MCCDDGFCWNCSKSVWIVVISGSVDTTSQFIIPRRERYWSLMLLSGVSGGGIVSTGNPDLYGESTGLQSVMSNVSII